jgi:hypothetical protein
MQIILYHKSIKYEEANSGSTEPKILRLRLIYEVRCDPPDTSNHSTMERGLEANILELSTGQPYSRASFRVTHILITSSRIRRNKLGKDSLVASIVHNTCHNKCKRPLSNITVVQKILVPQVQSSVDLNKLISEQICT